MTEPTTATPSAPAPMPECRNCGETVDVLKVPKGYWVECQACSDQGPLALTEALAICAYHAQERAPTQAPAPAPLPKCRNCGAITIMQTGPGSEPYYWLRCRGCRTKGPNATTQALAIIAHHAQLPTPAPKCRHCANPLHIKSRARAACTTYHVWCSHCGVRGPVSDTREEAWDRYHGLFKPTPIRDTAERMRKIAREEIQAQIKAARDTIKHGATESGHDSRFYWDLSQAIDLVVSK